MNMQMTTADLPRSRDKAAGRIAVAYRPIADLKLDPKNPRSHSRRQIRQIARSIETFGFITPVLVDADFSVIAGHGRLLACRELGWSEVPTVRLEHLTPQQTKAFQIADNRLTEISTWDDRLLGEQLKELSEVELDFSLEVTGFEVAEIDLRIEGIEQVEAEADRADKVRDSGPVLVPVSRPGDLWLLGRHRVYCGSALDATAYATVMNKEQATMVFTDPPYNVRIAGHASGLGAVKHAYINDFSFEGVSNAVDKQFGGILEGELTEEQETRARELMALSEKRRIASMEQYKQDGVVPFMRQETIEPDEKTIELDPVQLEVKSE